MSRSSRLGPALGVKSSKVPTRPQSENLQRYHQDLSLLNQRLTDLQQKLGSGSSFVANLRSNAVTEQHDGTMEDKVKIMETVLAKITELDRIVLQNTTVIKDNSSNTDSNGNPNINNSNKPVRRASRGMDLAILPTHLHVLDRIMDLHKTSQRVTVLKQTATSHTQKENNTNNEKILNKEKDIPPKVPIPPLDTNNNNNSNNMNNNVGLKMSIGGTASVKSPRPNPKLELANKELKEENSRFKSEIELLNKNIKDSISKEKLLIEEHDKNKAKYSKEVDTLEEKINIIRKSKDDEIDNLKKQLDIANQAASDARAIADEAVAAEQATFGLTSPRGESESLRDDLRRSEERIRYLEEQHECNESLHAAATRSLLDFGEKIASLSIEHFGSKSMGDGMHPDSGSALIVAAENVSTCINGLQSELNTLLAAKDSLESVIASYSLQQDMMSNDISSLTKENNDLKNNYENLLNEVKEGKKLAQDRASVNDGDKQKISELQAELAVEKRKTGQLDVLAGRIAELEVSLSTSIREMTSLGTKLRQGEEENKALKKLVDTLKERIRKMSTGDDMSTQDFLDSFEEVMREEMMAMKGAFEKKLRLAKEEADELSKKHREELNRMTQSSPVPGLGISLSRSSLNGLR